MRRVYRPELTLPSRALLRLEQKKVSDHESGREKWKLFRSSARGRPIINALKSMAGTRSRCFYCSDSLGADVEHYVPIDEDHRKTFSWTNMLWACPTCNRLKSAKFKTDGAHNPLLINPADVEPWSKLMLDTGTGNIVARYYDDDTWDPYGEYTVSVLKNLNHEAVTEGRSRVIRRLRETFTRVLTDGDTPEIRRIIRVEVAEDDYDVSSWFAHWEGSREQPFADVMERHANLRRRFALMCANSRAC